MLDTLASLETAEVCETQMLPVAQLRIGMVLASDVVTPTGAVVLQGGRQLTMLHLDRVKHFASGVGVVEPIKITWPESKSSKALLAHPGRPAKR